MRNKIPSFIVTIIGLVLIAEYFVDAPFLSSLASEFKNWGLFWEQRHSSGYSKHCCR